MKKLTLRGINLPVTIFREGKSYVAYSPALDLSTCAPTYKKARANFSEIVQIFIEELVEMGTLDEVLKDLGWQKIKSNWQPPVVVSNYFQPVDFSYA